MAKISFSRYQEYAVGLYELERIGQSGKLLDKAVVAGGNIVADEIRRRLENLPEDRFRYLEGDEKFEGVPHPQLLDLLTSFGLTPVQRDRGGFVNVKAGFDGYGSHPTSSYPKGIPNPLLARAVESGSSVREKTPFVRPAVNATRKQAVAAMDAEIRDGLEKIFGK